MDAERTLLRSGPKLAHRFVQRKDLFQVFARTPVRYFLESDP